jgi:hypothetical protein
VVAALANPAGIVRVGGKAMAAAGTSGHNASRRRSRIR